MNRMVERNHTIAWEVIIVAKRNKQQMQQNQNFSNAQDAEFAQEPGVQQQQSEKQSFKKQTNNNKR